MNSDRQMIVRKATILAHSAVPQIPSILLGTTLRPRTTGEYRTLQSKHDILFRTLGTSFGLAYLPIAPGTWGSLPGVAIFLIITYTAAAVTHTVWIALALIVVSFLCLVLSPWAERYWAMKDPGLYVLDEVAGFLVTVLLFRTPDPILTAVWAFILTRAMDILKPPPVRHLERLPSGWGILLDDVVASLYAAALLHLMARTLPAHLFGGSPVGLFW